MFANLVYYQKLLFAMVPKSRRDNRYCKKNDKGVNMDDYGSRYHAINPESYRKFKTIEVRLHSGTTDWVKINNWIELLSAIAYSKEAKQSNFNRIKDLTDWVKVSPELLEYVKNRIVKFNEPTRSAYILGKYTSDTESNDNLELSEAA
jgi:gamma-glutamyl:cysteine ligase YbdK (ATP-grasp superfamily)